MLLLVGLITVLSSCRKKTNEELLLGSWEVNRYVTLYRSSQISMENPETIGYFRVSGDCQYTSESVVVIEREVHFFNDYTYYMRIHFIVAPWKFCPSSSLPAQGEEYDLEYYGNWEMMEAGEGYEMGDRVKLFLHPCGEYFQVWALDNINRRKIRATFSTQGKTNCTSPHRHWSGDLEMKAI